MSVCCVFTKNTKLNLNKKTKVITTTELIRTFDK